MPRLRVLAGPSPDSLFPVKANSDNPQTIYSDVFEGKVIVKIKGFAEANGEVHDSEYFHREDRQGVTWSIQVQGRFLKPISSDDVLFGNTFDRPLKLPWGSGAALKFMHMIDPNLEHDLQSNDRPWALSPLISTMPHFIYTPMSRNQKAPEFPSSHSLQDDVSQLKVPNTKLKENDAQKRRAYFSQAANRKPVMFGPQDIITTDFCYGFIQFPELSLRIPGGISFDLMKYWDGQPVRFVCCERAKNGQHAVDVQNFWCVAIELVSNDDDSGYDSDY